MAYKKKRGRPKKRGPKKKKPIGPRTYVGLKRPYHIITTNNGVQLQDIYTAVSIDVGEKKLKELQERFNKNVRFPVRFISSHKEKTFTEADYRLMLIKKKEIGDSFVGKFKNEYGKYVDCSTDNDNWIFIDELPYMVEETFWVYGYNPKRQRKTFQFIFDELVKINSSSKLHVKQIVVVGFGGGGIDVHHIEGQCINTSGNGYGGLVVGSIIAAPAALEAEAILCG